MKVGVFLSALAGMLVGGFLFWYAVRDETSVQRRRIRDVEEEVGARRWWCSPSFCYRSRSACDEAGRGCEGHRVAFCGANEKMGGICFAALDECDRAAAEYHTDRCIGVE